MNIDVQDIKTVDSNATTLKLQATKQRQCQRAFAGIGPADNADSGLKGHVKEHAVQMRYISGRDRFILHQTQSRPTLRRFGAVLWLLTLLGCVHKILDTLQSKYRYSVSEPCEEFPERGLGKGGLRCHVLRIRGVVADQPQHVFRIHHGV